MSNKEPEEINIKKSQIDFDAQGNVLVKSKELKKAVETALKDCVNPNLRLNLLCNCFC
jgi:hypothetical protein